jgi:hypothetical protein
VGRRVTRAGGLLRHAAVAAAYLLLTLVMTYPLGLRLGTHFLRSGNDFWIYPWNNWWVRQAMLQGSNIYYTPYLLYPQGVSLISHGISWLSTLEWLPLQAVIGSLAAHNITILLTYVVGAYTTYLLALEVTGSFPAAFLAGLVFAFYPYRFAHRGQLKLLSNQWIPLFALYLVRVTRRGRLRDGLGAGVALALCALCSWHQMVLAGLWGTLWLGYSLVTERRRWSRRMLLGLALGGMVCAVLVGPLLVPVLVNWLDPSGAALEETETEKSTDLLAFALPNRYHPLFRLEGVYDAYRRYIHFEGSVAAVGWMVLLLGGVAVFKRGRQALPWLLGALILGVLALGSVLHVNGQALPGVPLPYALLRPTVFGEFMRHPNRFNIVIALPIAMLVALGWRELLTFGPVKGRWVGVATLCAAALILFEYSTAPVPTVSPQVSAFYQRLRDESGSFAVADFPMRDSTHDKYYMFLQTLHGRPMVGGHVSRAPVDARRFIESVPLLAAAQVGEPGRGMLDDVSRQLQPLAQAGVRYVLVHKDRAADEAVEGWRRYFGFQPVYEDEVLLVYRTEPEYGRDFGFTREMGDGIGLVGSTILTEDSGRGSLEVDLLWGTRAEPLHDWMARVILLSPSGEVRETVEVEPCAGWPTSEWPSDGVARGRAVVEAPWLFANGPYAVTVQLVDSLTGALASEAVLLGQVGGGLPPE